MKKFRNVILVLVLLMCIFTSTVNAATASVNVLANKTKINKGEEVNITLSIESLQDIGDGVLGMQGIIEYDKAIFETVKQSDFTMKNDWYKFEYNESNGVFTVLNPNKITTGQEVLVLKLIAKSNATSGSTATVKFKELYTTDNNQDIPMAAKSVSIQITDNQPILNNNTGNVVENTSKNTAITTKNISNSNKIANTTQLPKAGSEKYIIPVIFIILIIGFGSYIAYRKINLK